jgi:hypothetical protein
MGGGGWVVQEWLKARVGLGAGAAGAGKVGGVGRAGVDQRQEPAASRGVVHLLLHREAGRRELGF